MPMRVTNETYLRSFQCKVLNSILYTNELLIKIGYASNPNCSFFTIPSLYLYEQILSKLKSFESFTP